MNIKLHIRRLSFWLSHFFTIQLFLSCISLPFLLAWGLPLSPLSILGNLIFNILLILFLLLSSLIFFSELLHLPNGILIFCLEQVSSLWMRLLHSADALEWGYTFTKPSSFILLAIPLAVFFLLQHKRIITTHRRLLSLSILLTIIISMLHINRPTSLAYQIDTSSTSLAIHHEENQTLVSDNGFFAKQISAESWIEFNFIPELIKRSGRKKIDHLIIHDINARTFDALTILMDKTSIGTIYLPSFEGSLNKAQNRAYARYAAQRSKSQTTIRYLKKEPITIELGKKQIMITPGGFEKKGKLSYSKITINEAQLSISKTARAGAAPRPITLNGKQIKK